MVVISREKAIDLLDELEEWTECGMNAAHYARIRKEMCDMPETITTCKDCKNLNNGYCRKISKWVENDDFCSFAQREDKYIKRTDLLNAIDETDWHHLDNGQMKSGAIDEENAFYKASDIYACIDSLIKSKER